MHAVAPEDRYSDKIAAMGIRYHPVSMRNSGTQVLNDLRLINRIARIFRSIDPHIVLNYTIKPNIYGGLVANALNIPCINNVSGLGTVFLTRNLSNWIARKLYKWSFKNSDKVFFQNHQDMQLFLDRGLLTGDNYELIPGSGINTQYFKPMENSGTHNDFTFLMMARLLKEKGVMEYAKAAEILTAKGLPVRCQLMGNPESSHRRGVRRRHLKSWTREGYIEYLGEIEDVRPTIAGADALVLPSYREGLPKSLLEGASMEKPLIAARVAGCMDVVNDQINGLLCEPRNAVDLADKMEVLLSLTEDERKAMGMQGRKLVQAEFEEHLVIDKYLKAIKEITDKKRP